MYIYNIIYCNFRANFTYTRNWRNHTRSQAAAAVALSQKEANGAVTSAIGSSTLRPNLCLRGMGCRSNCLQKHSKAIGGDRESGDHLQQWFDVICIHALLSMEIVSNFRNQGTSWVQSNITHLRHFWGCWKDCFGLETMHCARMDKGWQRLWRKMCSHTTSILVAKSFAGLCSQNLPSHCFPHLCDMSLPNGQKCYKRK